LKKTEEKQVVSVSDGLGSGIKASILSTLTASMATTMVLNDVPISEVFSSIISTLPTCKVRGISYATLATCYVNHVSGDCHIFEYDFPVVLFYREGEFVELERKYTKYRVEKFSKAVFKLSPEISSF